MHRRFGTAFAQDMEWCGLELSRDFNRATMGLAPVAQQKSVWMFRGWRTTCRGGRRNLDRQRDSSVCARPIFMSQQSRLYQEKERLWETRCRRRN